MLITFNYLAEHQFVAIIPDKFPLQIIEILVSMEFEYLFKKESGFSQVLVIKRIWIFEVQIDRPPVNKLIYLIFIQYLIIFIPYLVHIYSAFNHIYSICIPNFLAVQANYLKFHILNMIRSNNSFRTIWAIDDLKYYLLWCTYYYMYCFYNLFISIIFVLLDHRIERQTMIIGRHKFIIFFLMNQIIQN